jgi:excisionase family DNA binding protein
MEDRDYTPEAVAELVGLTSNTIRRACRAGRFPGAYKLLGQWRIRRDAIDAIRNGGGDS